MGERQINRFEGGDLVVKSLQAQGVTPDIFGFRWAAEFHLQRVRNTRAAPSSYPP